ncbi:hypothetical protein H9P43_009721 [Blastocladiella emersonii ATCC 22665]|nr:hypothetical protein H9P43_009721 [Blastocladiella emersonii ATCC 22665]
MGFNPKNATATKKRAKQKWAAARAPTAPTDATVSAAKAAYADLDQNLDEMLAIAQRNEDGDDPTDAPVAVAKLEAMLADIQRLHQEARSMRPQRTTAAELAKYRRSVAAIVEFETIIKANLELLRPIACVPSGSSADIDPKVARVLAEYGVPISMMSSPAAGSSDGRFVELE